MSSIQRTIAVAVAEVAIGHGAPRDELTPLLGEPDAERLPIEQLYNIWELGLSSTNCRGLPVRVGKLASFDRYGALGIALYVSRVERFMVAQIEAATGGAKPQSVATEVTRVLADVERVVRAHQGSATREGSAADPAQRQAPARRARELVRRAESTAGLRTLR